MGSHLPTPISPLPTPPQEPPPSPLEADFLSFLFENDFQPLLPELFLVVACLSLLLYGVVTATSAGGGYPLLLRNVSWLAHLALLLSLLLLGNNPVRDGLFLYHTFLLDDVTLFFKITVVAGGVLSLLLSIDYLQRERVNSFEFALLTLLSLTSMLFLVSSGDFISMYLAIELQSLCFYVLAAFKRDSEFSTEAGLKYFLLGAFSSGLLLFGCSLVYGFTGVVEFSELERVFTSGTEQGGGLTSSWRGCELGMIFLLIGFLFKLTAAPFHMWAPDVYEGAPTAVTAFFSITAKASFLILLSRLLSGSFYPFMGEWQTFLIFCSLASMGVGSVAGLAQQRIKRLLAFSSIGHVGYLLIALCCGTLEGLQGLMIYLVVYMVMTANIFAAILSPLRRSGVNELERIKYTNDLALLAGSNSALAATLTLSLFSLAGIPPLAGFYSKAFLFWSALSSSHYLLPLVGVITSAISCFYYIRVVKVMYFETPKRWLTFKQIPKESSLLLAVTLLLIAGLMAYPSPLYFLTHRATLAFSL